MEKKIINQEELKKFELSKKTSRCRLCSNNCELTINSFSTSKKKYITGNRCDKPIKKTAQNEIGNMYEYKRIRAFDYTPQDKDYSKGEIGIPRVLNIYEHYPFWYTFFEHLDYKVVVSPNSDKHIYELGMETIPSDTLCYPAKLVNGHIQYLLNQDVKKIFYPSVMYDVNANDQRGFNCPVVISYPEVIKKNMDSIEEKNCNFIAPFISFSSQKVLLESLLELADELAVSKKDIKEACEKGYKELEKYKQDVFMEGLRILNDAKENNQTVFVLSGRPYHIDKEISHQIDKTITTYGIPVITEDVVAQFENDEIKLRAVDQWAFHSRLYKAAEYVGKNEGIELIQLNSFGCGLDAITTDQVKEILEHHNKVYTCLKIDEGENLGAAKIRIRSLSATVKQRKSKNTRINLEKYEYEAVKPKYDLKEYTILAPQMSPIHFEFLQKAVEYGGYNIKILPDVDYSDIDMGLKYVNNDSCYPALVAIGQLMKAISEYDLDEDKVALLISQTGGGCRATNYIALLRRALHNAGYQNIPVFSVATTGTKLDDNALPIDFSTMQKAIMGLVFGDLFLRIVHQIRPYEVNSGETDRLAEECKKKVYEVIESGSYSQMKKLTAQIVERFDAIKTKDFKQKPRVGIVGEILVKYHPSANNNLVKVIEENGGEAVIPDMLDFFLYGFMSKKFVAKSVEKSKKQELQYTAIIKVVEEYRGFLKKAIKKSKKFDEIHNINSTAKKAQEFLSLGNATGEGWFLTGEMINLLDDKVNNIICTQPFGCLPNHITGKGMIKALKEKYQGANILAVDYDPGASEVNQISRIKLMLSVAKRMQNNEVK